MNRRQGTGLATPWRWSMVSTPIVAAAGLYAGAALLDVLNVGVWYVVLVGVCAAIGTGVACRKVEPGRFASVYAVLTVLGAVGWLTWTTATTAWSQRALAILASGLALFGPLWFLARHTHLRKRMKEREEERRQREAAEARRWPDMLAGLGMPGTTQIERKAHSEGCYSVHLQLPKNGKVKFGTLKGRTEDVEIAAGLRYGALRVERGNSAADVWLHVNEIDVLAKTVPLPRDNTPLSINHPVPMGLYEDGSTLAVPMQGRASKTVGLRGKGKSNLINVKLAAFTRCVDVVVWMIDNKGGRTARPWLLPWLEGRTHRPVIDWVATTRAEVARMLQAAEAVIDYRSNSGTGGDKITPTARTPELMILCEEVALIFGQHDTSNLENSRRGLKIVQLGRAEAVSIDLVAQRGTVTMLGSGDLKSQLENTFGLGVGDANDARYTFGDTKIAADLAALEHPGSLLVQAGQDTRVVPAKSWWVEYEEIGGPGGIAERNTHIGPDLDPGSAAAADAAGGYAQRWSEERAGHLLSGRGTPSELASVSDTSPRAGSGAPTSTAERLGLAPSNLVSSPYDMASPANDRSSLRVVADEASGAVGDQKREKPSYDGMPATSEPVVPPVLRAVHQAFKDADTDRLHTTRLLESAELAGLSAKRLGMLLAACGVQPLSQPFVADGQRGRGYHYSDVAAARQRAADGRIRPPDYAFGWTGPDDSGSGGQDEQPPRDP